MTNSKNSALDRLARAYPNAFKAEASRTKPFYEVSSKTSVMNHFHNATDSVMGKAIMLAVMLDQYNSGEADVEPSVRGHAAELFEEAFKNLAGA
jgi:hypothetical protein